MSLSPIALSYAEMQRQEMRLVLDLKSQPAKVGIGSEWEISKEEEGKEGKGEKDKMREIQKAAAQVAN